MTNRTRLIRQGALLAVTFALCTNAFAWADFDGDDTSSAPPPPEKQSGSWDRENSFSYPAPKVMHDTNRNPPKPIQESRAADVRNFDDENTEYTDSVKRENYSQQAENSDTRPTPAKYARQEASNKADSEANDDDSDSDPSAAAHVPKNYVMKMEGLTPGMDFRQNFTRLQEVLPIYEEAVAHPWAEIPVGGRSLHAGMHDDDVLLLRSRLKATRDLAQDAPDINKFDRQLVEAVKIFQMRHGLRADGVVGDATKAEMNISPQIRVAQIRLNMQRWADLSATLGHRFVMVNIPEYKLHIVDNDREVLSMKVVVGRPTRQTPELASNITRIVFNPHWSVPDMIAKNDIVPKVLENPSYLASNGIRIFNTDGDGAYEISRSDVNWSDAEENGFPYHFRQDPGMKNALGQVKFEFQNTHDVYLHDTPAKALFNADRRDFSSGCIRLEKPFALVDYLTQNDQRIDDQKISDTLESRVTTYFKVEHSIPIIITYLTAWVDDKGYTHFADDLYGRDGLIPEQYTGEDDKIPE